VTDLEVYRGLAEEELAAGVLDPHPLDQLFQRDGANGRAALPGDRGVDEALEAGLEGRYGLAFEVLEDWRGDVYGAAETLEAFVEGAAAGHL
jgi:hypothetical protein